MSLPWPFKRGFDSRSLNELNATIPGGPIDLDASVPADFDSSTFPLGARAMLLHAVPGYRLIPADHLTNTDLDPFEELDKPRRWTIVPLDSTADGGDSNSTSWCSPEAAEIERAFFNLSLRDAADDSRSEGSQYDEEAAAETAPGDPARDDAHASDDEENTDAVADDENEGDDSDSDRATVLDSDDGAVADDENENTDAYSSDESDSDPAFASTPCTPSSSDLPTPPSSPLLRRAYNKASHPSSSSGAESSVSCEHVPEGERAMQTAGSIAFTKGATTDSSPSDSEGFASTCAADVLRPGFRANQKAAFSPLFTAQNKVEKHRRDEKN